MTKQEKLDMSEFTMEQLSLLSEYSPQTIAYAHKTLQEQVAAGKRIAHPFGYLLGVCKRHKHNPQTGKHKPSSSMQYLTITQNPTETNDYQSAYDLEMKRHELWTRGNLFSSFIPNPALERLTAPQQQEILSVHKACTCRPT